MHNQYDFIVDRWTRLKDRGVTFSNVLDIGANTGQFYKEFKSVFPESSILSIEGNPKCEKELVKVNPNSKIMLLGKEKGITSFYTSTETCPGASMYKETTQWYDNFNEITLPVKILDDLEGEFDYIKMDTQGSELDIIKGGISKILQCKILQLELSISRFNKGAPLASEIISFLGSLGFEILDIGSLFYWKNQLNQSDFVFLNTRFGSNLLNVR